MVISLMWPRIENVVKQTIPSTPPKTFIKLIGIAAPRQPIPQLRKVAVLTSMDDLLVNSSHFESSKARDS